MSGTNTFTLAACGVALALLAPLASAVNPAANSAADLNGQGCRYRYAIDPRLAGELTGRYVLSNGEALKVSRVVSRYYAEMPATGRIEIVPVDQDVFVQRDGPVQLAFEREAFTARVVVAGLDGRASGPPLCQT